MNPSMQKSYRERLAGVLAAKQERERVDWGLRGRPQQKIPPRNWSQWLFLGRRGVGKTEAGAQAVREWSRSFRYVDVVGPTSETTRNICIEGPSGILACCPDSERPEWSPSLRTMTWQSGCKTRVLGADEPDRFR